MHVFRKLPKKKNKDPKLLYEGSASFFGDVLVRFTVSFEFSHSKIYIECNKSVGYKIKRTAVCKTFVERAGSLY